MKQEDKDLLFKDLCTRLPYGIIINIGDRDLRLDKKYQNIGVLYPEDCSDEFNERNNNTSFYIIISGCYYGENIKPYLRTLSSMTEEEKEEYHHLCYNYYSLYFDNTESIDWLDSHYFDHRNLIPKGLALEAPSDMYNNE